MDSDLVWTSETDFWTPPAAPPPPPAPPPPTHWINGQPAPPLPAPEPEPEDASIDDMAGGEISH